MTGEGSMCFGLTIHASETLVGAKLGYAFSDNVVLVSPAMYDLLSHADKSELKRLVVTIKLKRLPFPYKQSVAMEFLEMTEFPHLAMRKPI